MVKFLNTKGHKGAKQIQIVKTFIYSGGQRGGEGGGGEWQGEGGLGGQWRCEGVGEEELSSS